MISLTNGRHYISSENEGVHKMPLLLKHRSLQVEAKL